MRWNFFHLPHVCCLRSHVQWTGNVYDTLDSLHRSFTPSLHVYSGHSPEFSRSYCWAELPHIQKSVNQLNTTFLDILRGGSWEKSGSPRVSPLPLLRWWWPSPKYSYMYTLRREDKKKKFFFTPPQAKWKREQKHILCLEVAIIAQKHLSRQPRRIPKRPVFKAPSPKFRRERKEKNNKKGRGKCTTCTWTSSYKVLRKEFKEGALTSNKGKSKVHLIRIRGLRQPKGCRSLTGPRGVLLVFCSIRDAFQQH